MTDPQPTFRDIALGYAQVAGHVPMLPVIEKELLHYEILDDMDRHGFLGRLVFQGGTCLRLCYGSERYSEDLDFAGGPDFQADDLAGLGKILEGGIAAVSTRPSYANSWSTNSTTTTSGTRSPQDSTVCAACETLWTAPSSPPN